MKRVFGNILKTIDNNIYRVGANSVLFHRVGKPASIYSGDMTLCSFATVKVYEDDKLIGNVFVHQNNQPIGYKSGGFDKGVVEHVITAANTSYQYNGAKFDTIDDLTSFLGESLKVANAVSNVTKKRESASWWDFCTATAFDVDEKGKVRKLAKEETQKLAETIKKSEGYYVEEV